MAVKAIVLGGFVMLAATSVLAAVPVEECMQQLPQTIKIDNDMGEIKQTPDSFVDFESKQAGLGYSQGYDSDLCHATVYVYDMGKKAPTQEDLEANFEQMKAEIAYVYDEIYKHKLTMDAQYKVPVSDSTFFAISGTTDKTSEVAMLGLYKNQFLKGRATCARLGEVEGYTAEDLKKASIGVALQHTDSLMEAVAKNLDKCLK